MTWIHFAIIEPAFLSGRALEPGGNQWSVCEERAGSEHRGYHREWDRNRSTGNTAWTELPTCWEIREQYTHWGGERLHTVSKVCVCMMLSSEEEMLAQSVQVNNNIVITPCLSPSFIFLPATLPYSSSPPPFFFLAFLFSLSLSIHHLSTCSSHSFFLAVSFLSLTISLFFPFVHLLFSLHSLLPPSYHSFVYICLPVYAAIFLSYPSSLSLLSSCPPFVFLFFSSFL